MSTDIYVTGAFRSARKNEAYIFMKNEYVLDDYAPGRIDDKILYGPTRIREVFSSLKGTIFEDGIDCAFGSHNLGESYIFAWNNCAKFFYAPYSTNDKILKGPMPIATMFPFLKDTVFENGVDAAFESSIKHEAYLFKGNQYARINYGPENPRLMNQGPIGKFWPCLKGTIFENGIEAAFASHLENEAYLFKRDSYARIKFTPGATNDVLMGGVKKIKPNWQGLGSILPRKSRTHNLVCN